MNSAMSSARPVTIPSRFRPASNSTSGSGPTSPTARRQPSGGGGVQELRELVRLLGPGNQPRAGKFAEPLGVDLRCDDAEPERPAFPDAKPVDLVEGSLEVHVCTGDPDREQEGELVLDRGAEVGPQVVRQVCRQRVAGAEPVRAPVAAGALRDDVVDAPFERPRDRILDIRRRRDVVDEPEDAERRRFLHLDNHAYYAHSCPMKRSCLRFTAND